MYKSPRISAITHYLKSSDPFLCALNLSATLPRFSYENVNELFCYSADFPGSLRPKQSKSIGSLNAGFLKILLCQDIFPTHVSFWKIQSSPAGFSSFLPVDEGTTDRQVHWRPLKDSLFIYFVALGIEPRTLLTH